MFDRIHTQKCESCANNKQMCCFVCGVGQNGEREYYNPKPKINADRFRTMSDMEIASFFYWDVDGSGKTQWQWLEWLRQECE